MALDHLSFSSINQYITCGLQFRFRKIDQLEPEYTSDALVFGSCIHNALAKFNQQRTKGVITTPSELGDWFEAYWSGTASNNGIRYSSGNNYESCLKQGKDLLELYYQDTLEDTKYQILDIEKEFRLNIENLRYPIIGYIDLVETDEYGNILITEYKTSGKSYSKNQIDHNEQLTLYHLAMQRLYPDREIINKIDCLIKTKIPKCEQYYTYRDQEDHRRLMNIIGQVIRGIEAEVFIPNTNSWRCSGCEYKSACKSWLKS